MKIQRKGQGAPVSSSKSSPTHPSQSTLNSIPNPAKPPSTILWALESLILRSINSPSRRFLEDYWEGVDLEGLSNRGVSEIEPRLPPEVEHLIFTLAFDASDHKANTTLILVARRVHKWIYPLMYRILDEVSEPPTPDFTQPGCPTVEQIGSFAHHLVVGRIHDTTEEVHHLLQHCQNLKTLACWYGINMKPLLSNLNAMVDLRVLSADLDKLTEDDMSSPTLLRLTHIEVISANEDLLKYLPSFIQKSQVTHLRLYALQFWDAKLIENILQSCPQLQALTITKQYEETFSSEYLENTSKLLQNMYKTDIRLVVLDSSMCTADDWILGIKGFHDCWSYSDQIVTARSKKYLQDGDYQNKPFTSRFDWRGHLTEEGKAWYAQEERNERVYCKAS
ncbi:hypothetical protein CVT24_004229 [Panaeolus cyanescens]|uniref:F-box domain-containing protein n=1 Tax=Panaeolus cyanescens TaxID=181874 RepID=A0A409YST5_9AGAR|nr:hypothetical protein CVT24_004229 [Panaeolus cyanescens]